MNDPMKFQTEMVPGTPLSDCVFVPESVLCGKRGCGLVLQVSTLSVARSFDAPLLCKPPPTGDDALGLRFDAEQVTFTAGALGGVIGA